MMIEQNCNNGCIRRMDLPKVGKGQFYFHRGTLDCPVQISSNDDEIIEAMVQCGCCSFDNGKATKSILDCRVRKGTGDWAECTSHNSLIVYTTCLSKRNHGACPYGLKGDKE